MYKKDCILKVMKERIAASNRVKTEKKMALNKKINSTGIA